jgi:tetratricopeptide (TPR) repeat protein
MAQADRAELYVKLRKRMTGILWIVGGVGLLLFMVIGFAVVKQEMLIPGGVIGFVCIGVIRAGWNDLTQANIAKQKLALIDREAAEANDRGVKLKASGDIDGAIREYTAAIGINPSFVEAFSNRGSALYETRNLNAALRDLTMALQLKPSNADGYYNRAKVLEQIDNPSAAIADFRKYLDLGGGIRSGDTEEVLGFIADIEKKLQASK